MPQDYQVKLEQFEGPLHLLLQLIEGDQLEISKISLAKVTDQFIEYINNSQAMDPEEVADFLVVASKLLLIKSKILLPDLEIQDEEANELEKQLKIYKEYYEASRVIEQLIRRKRFTFARAKPIRVITPKFSPPSDLTSGSMKSLFEEALKRIEAIVSLPKEVIKKTITIAEKILFIKNLIFEKVNIGFKKLIGENTNKVEIIVSFLALLELVKQRTIIVKQDHIFEEIEIKKYTNETWITADSRR